MASHFPFSAIYKKKLNKFSDEKELTYNSAKIITRALEWAIDYRLSGQVTSAPCPAVDRERQGSVCRMQKAPSYCSAVSQRLLLLIYPKNLSCVCSRTAVASSHWSVETNIITFLSQQLLLLLSLIFFFNQPRKFRVLEIRFLSIGDPRKISVVVKVA